MLSSAPVPSPSAPKSLTFLISANLAGSVMVGGESNLLRKSARYQRQYGGLKKARDDGVASRVRVKAVLKIGKGLSSH